MTHSDQWILVAIHNLMFWWITVTVTKQRTLQTVILNYTVILLCSVTVLLYYYELLYSMFLILQHTSEPILQLAHILSHATVIVFLARSLISILRACYWAECDLLSADGLYWLVNLEAPAASMKNRPHLVRSCRVSRLQSSACVEKSRLLWSLQARLSQLLLSCLFCSL